MGRHKKYLFFPKDLSRMVDILTLVIDYHAVGFLVLCGKVEWPDAEELCEMIAYQRGIPESAERVQGGTDIPIEQRKVEARESAGRILSFIDKYGGTQIIAKAMREYKYSKPQEYELLHRIGMAGFPGAKSLEAIAGEKHMDIKTLYAAKRTAIKEIAFYVVYANKDELVLVSDDIDKMAG